MLLIKAKSGKYWFSILFFLLFCSHLYAAIVSYPYKSPNKKGDTINDSSLANNHLFKGKYINNGTITDTSGGGFKAQGSFINNGIINISKSNTLFYDQLTNTITGEIISLNYGLDVYQTATNSGTIKVKCPSFGSLTNTITGKIIVLGNTGLVVAGRAINRGFINITQSRADFYKILINYGKIIYAGSDDDGVGVVAAGVINSGFITITKGFAELDDELINTETGKIIASGGNDQGISLFAANTVTNMGSITISNIMTLKQEKYIINQGYFVAASITVVAEYADNSFDPASNTANFNNKNKAVAKFTSIINEHWIDIDNKGSISMQGSSTIGFYSGNQYSELVLTIPANQPTVKSAPLLKVTKDAFFDSRSKIILAGTKTFLNKSYTTKVRIVEAKKLIIGGSPDELLYSRAYDSKGTEVQYSPKPQLTTGSMLIQITDATASIGKAGQEDYLEADLKLYTIPDNLLSAYQSKLIQSILDNSLYNKLMVAVPKPTTLKLTTPKLTTPKLTTPKLTTKPLGIEYYKPLDNHFMIIKEIATNFAIELKQGLQKPTRLNFDSKNYNLWSSIGYYTGKYTQHKWHEMLLCIGGSSYFNTVKLGVSCAYLDTNMSTNNKKTQLSGYYGIAYLDTYINDICFNSVVIYSRTNHKHNSDTIGKYTDEVSVAATANYKYIVDNFTLDLGINSRLMNISLSTDNNSKSFVSLGSFFSVTAIIELVDATVRVSLDSGYNYTTDIFNNNKKAINPFTTAKLRKHMLHTKLKAHIDYHDWFYGLSINYRHAKDQNIFGCKFIIGYVF